MNKIFLCLLLGTYALCLFLVLPHLSLWLDEVLTVMGSTKPTFSGMIEFVPLNAGGVPLGFVAQRISFAALGVSDFSARVPSALGSLAAAYGMFVLAERLGMRRPLAAVALFCILPLQWRYAIEARPYAMALALSVWSTILFLNRRPFWYGLAVTAGLYTNPYSFFIPAAHMVWLLFHWSRSEMRLRLALLSNCVAALLFLPWYLYARHIWALSVPVNGSISGFKAAELIFKELVGAGYIGTVLVLLPAVAGWRKQFGENPRHASLLAACLLVPVPLVLCGNALFHYFLAARQLIFVLPPLCLLAAMGIDAEK